jgi:hypothetical protein
LLNFFAPKQYNLVLHDVVIAIIYNLGDGKRNGRHGPNKRHPGPNKHHPGPDKRHPGPDKHYKISGSNPSQYVMYSNLYPSPFATKYYVLFVAQAGLP